MDLIYYYLPALETIRDFMELGGDVLFVIGFLTLVHVDADSRKTDLSPRRT